MAAGYRHDLPGALLYYSNWLNIISQTSYFEFIGRPPILKHLWSLALEEQFYLIWPTVALLAYRWRGARGVGRVALVGALLSTLVMAVGSFLGDMPGGADPSRLYFGTDSHAMGVLLGAALAVVWRPGRTSPVLRPQARAVITLAGTLALAVLVWMFTAAGEYSVWLYRGGFLVVCAFTAVVVAAASHRGVPFGRWLGMRPMRWVGERSYGIYLWHWPLFVVTRPGVDIPVDGLAAFALRITLLLGVAELSYRYLEMPVRRGALGRAWQRVREGDVGAPSRAAVAVVAVVAVLGLAAGYRVATAPEPTPTVALTSAELGMVAPARAPLEADFARWADARGEDPRARVTAFGDSVLLGASSALERQVFNVDLHAKVATQASAILDLIQAQAHDGAIRRTVILHVGNNGIVTEEQLRGMLDALQGARSVVLVNVRVPRAWMKPNNALIERLAPDYPNVRVADWATVSAGHRDYMVKDGVHLTWKGAQAYTKLLARTAGVKAPKSG